MARRIRHGDARRGVLLLMVLALLAMFGLLGISYVMISGQANRGAEALSKVEQAADSPAQLLNQAAAQVIRGSTNPASVLYPHSLLEDMYGNDTASGTVAAAAGLVGGQLVNVTLSANLVLKRSGVALSSDEPLLRIGSVLTVVGPATSNALGRSYRIVGGSTTGFQLLADGVPSPSAGDEFVVNGVPFSGTGQGFNPASGAMDLPFTDAGGDPRNAWPIALLPRPFANTRDYNDWQSGANPSAALINALAATQMHEDYDAPDFQSMLLGMMLPGGQTPMPSLHRPELVNYWQTQAASQWNDTTLGPQLRRKVILRPLARLPGDPATFPADHPNFTGSNPYFNPAWDGVTAGGGQWDVDNDGDGIPDSIWIDPGMPARTSRDGRTYKPLVAILCLDMDGRLNLNAHGSTAQTATEYGNQASGPFAGATGPGYEVSLPRGEGYGPAEVRLPTTMIPAAEVTQLLQGNGTVEGRYGELGAASPGPQAGLTNTWDAMSRFKFFEFPDDSYLDPVSGGTLDTSKLTSYFSPPDLWGRGVFGVDYAGQPLYWRPSTFNGVAANWWATEVLNNPYRLNLSPKAVRRGAPTGSTVDNPFTAAELERVLRNYDADAGRLPRRLLDLAPSLAGHRTEVTTDSSDVPCPPGSLRLSAELTGTRARGVADLLARKLAANGVSSANIPTQVARMLPWDLLANRRMDVNRPLGNARDNNANGVVDEWQEATPESGWFNIFPRSGTGPAGTTDGNSDGQIDSVVFWLTNAIDVNNDGNVDVADQPLARHLMARHLYVLGMLLAEIGYKTGDGLFFLPSPGEGSLNDNERRELTARRVAQWAINVVDFRDADSVMTPFEYDANPFNGWSVDGDVSTDEGGERRIVWGCEAPELLLTETLNFHDRRVADTSFDSTGKKRTDDTDGDNVPDDDDLDQPLIPRGSTFLELYCPRNPNNPIVSSDLYTYSSGQWYLDVGRLAPAGGGGTPQYPVWRIAISESKIANGDNDVLTYVSGHPHSASIEPKQQRGMAGSESKDGLSLLNGSTPPKVQIDRIVWLARFQPVAQHDDYRRVYYNRTTTTGIPCGGYAVVGPRFVTPIGGTTTLGEPSPHVIDLDPVRVVDNDGTNRYPDTSTTIKAPVSMVVAADPPNSWGANPDAADLDPGTSHGLSGSWRYGIGISISEPIPSLGDYYPEPKQANSRNGNLVEAYCDVTNGNITGNPNIMDHPFDSERSGGGVFQRPLGIEGLLRTQTTRNYKTVFLQRLADPGKAYQPDPSQANWNPYLTVDWSPIDLTVFNGTDRLPGTAIPGNYPWDTLDDGATAADDNPNATTDVRFASRQRGGHTYAGGANLWASRWEAASTDPPETQNQTATTLNFRHNLGWTTTSAPVLTNPAAVVGQTLGYVSRGYGAPWAPPATPVVLRQVYRGTPTDIASGNPNPFPWLAWNNRPFVSPMEVLTVPTSSSARLCWEFTTASNEAHLYTGPSGGSEVFGIPFGHLLDFFQAEASGGITPPAFYRLLDFLEVPSRFQGTELVLNPQYAGRTDTWEQHLNRPPFNRVSNFRDPGRVNINTIASANVWAGVLNGHSGPDFDNDLVPSRRGYAGASIAAMNAAYPTRFANPFRSGCSADLTPNVAGMLKTRPVNTTLLRASGINPDADDTPLLADPSDVTELCRNPIQHAYFRYQSLSRLANLVTTRSNVYAVWITVGYFEVGPDPATGLYTIDAGHPDGYRLGRELGSDTGDIKRHRAFYLIDRSIPVGFVRGQDLNVGNTILLNRFIE